MLRPPLALDATYFYKMTETLRNEFIPPTSHETKFVFIFNALITIRVYLQHAFPAFWQVEISGNFF